MLRRSETLNEIAAATNLGSEDCRPIGYQNETTKMSDKSNIDSPTIQGRLNAIADAWTASNELPADTTWNDITDQSIALYKQLEDYIQAVETDTPFSRAEAEMWALRRTVDEQSTFLAYEAIELLLVSEDTPFTALAQAIDEITTSTVEEYAADVTAAVERAQDLAVAVEAPQNVRPASPAIAVLDRDTKRRLQDTATPDEESLDDVVSRLLREAETDLSLGEFCEQYLDERGREDVNQLAVQETTLEGGHLSVTVHGSRSQDVPNVVTETDTITIAGRRFDFHLVEDPYGPHNFERIPIYGWMDTDKEDVTLDEGVAAVRERVQELLTRDGAPTPGSTRPDSSLSQ